MRFLRFFFASIFALAFSITSFAAVAADTTINSATGTAITSLPSTSTSSKTADQQIVNINTAAIDQLDTLKGIGAKKAQAIIDYRTQNGNFKSVDDLSSVKGISQKIIDENRDRLTAG